MRYSIANKQNNTREEINNIYNIWCKIHSLRNRKNKIKKILISRYIAICKNNQWKVIWISAIKNSKKEKIKMIFNNAWVAHSDKNNIKEYGYVYINKRYRGKWIATTLFKLLNQKDNGKKFATTKEDNYMMKKTLNKLWFIKVWNSWENSNGNFILYIR